MSTQPVHRNHEGTPTAAGSAELVRLAAAGDELAWASLVDRYTGMVWSICRSHRLARDDAADVVQVVWLRLVENLDRVADPDRVGGWLATTARRECLRVLRRHRRSSDAEVEVRDPAPGPYQRVEQAERVRVLAAAMDRLPEPERVLLRVLADPERPSYAEVAAMLDIPVGSIGPRRMRALERLRRQLELFEHGSYRPAAP